MKTIKATIICAAVALAVPSTAQAQPALAEARRAGIVGERFDGYLGTVRTPSEAVRRQVAAVNIKRRSLYVGLGARRRVTPETAGYATGCELLSRVKPGEAYLLQDGVWRRRRAGEPAPKPAYCG